MSYKRVFAPQSFSSSDKLDNDLAGMGIRIACDKPSVDPNIEDTLIAAIIDELVLGNTRVLALVTDWIGAHSKWINVERLYRAIRSLDAKEFKAIYIYFSAIGKWLSKDKRFLKLATLYKGNRVRYLKLANLPDMTEGLLKRNGEDPRFKDTCLIVPNKTIRHEPKHIVNARDLSKTHMPFRYRVMMGSNFRADIWGTLRRTPTLSAYELAKKTYSPYESARHARSDYQIVKRDYSSRTNDRQGNVESSVTKL